MFYEYYEKTLGYPTSTSLRAWSPAAASFFRVDCVRGSVVRFGAEITFSSDAATAYDDKQGRVGDGPDDTSEVRVVGDDHYDLDRDGDAVASEPY